MWPKPAPAAGMPEPQSSQWAPMLPARVFAALAGIVVWLIFTYNDLVALRAGTPSAPLQRQIIWTDRVDDDRRRAE